MQAYREAGKESPDLLLNGILYLSSKTMISKLVGQSLTRLIRKVRTRTI